MKQTPSRCSWSGSTLLLHEAPNSRSGRRPHPSSSSSLMSSRWSQHRQHSPTTASAAPYTVAAATSSASSSDQSDGQGRTRRPTQIFATKLRYHYLLITLATIASYWPSIWGELVFDDRPALIDNKDIRPSTPLYRLFLNDYWGHSLSEELSHKSYRPLTVLTFRWNFWFHGLNPIGYHAINLGLHSIVSILFYKLSLFFVPEMALTTSLLFALHPVHTDAVASVVGRAELLSALFYLGCLLIHLSKASKYKPLLTISFSWLGFLCKEQCLTGLIVCTLCDLVVSFFASGHHQRHHHQHHSQPHYHRLSSRWWQAQASSVKNGSHGSVGGGWATTRTPLVLFLGFVLASLFRVWINGQSAPGQLLAPTFNKWDNPASVESPWTQTLTYAYLGAFHFWTTLMPANLACDWTHGSVRLVRSLGQSENVLTMAFFVLLAAVAIRCRRNCQILIILAMTVVPFIPASNIFFKTGFVVAERVMYLPSIGFVLLLAKGLQTLMRWRPSLGWFFQAWLLLSFGLKTYQRCHDWHNETSLFTSGLKVNPQNIKLLNNVGRLLEKAGNTSGAKEYFEQAISVEPASLRSLLNLGNLYVTMNNYTAAEVVYRQSVKLVEEDYYVRRRTSGLHVTALLRLTAVLSRDPSREKETRKIHEFAILLTSSLTNNGSSNGSGSGASGYGGSHRGAKLMGSHQQKSHHQRVSAPHVHSAGPATGHRAPSPPPTLYHNANYGTSPRQQRRNTF